MKNKGIWFVMTGIITVGTVITVCNSVFIENRKDAPTMMAYEVLVEESSADSAADEQPVAAGAGQEENSQVVITPLDTSAAEETELEKPVPNTSYPGSSRITVLEETQVNYKSRLDEVGLQIQRIRSEETESTTYSMKTAAENELKLWDSELNVIYSDILNDLDEEQTQALIAEEREWMKARDAKAVEAAKKSAGGTLEGLEYIASLAESTRIRAYELADRYEQVAK